MEEPDDDPLDGPITNETRARIKYHLEKRKTVLDAEKIRNTLNELAAEGKLTEKEAQTWLARLIMVHYVKPDGTLSHFRTTD